MLRDARPEVELLVRCARTELDDETASQIRTLVRQDLDWDYLLEIARQHGVTPLLYKQLTATVESALPNAPRERLRNAFRRSTEHNLYLTSELHRLLARFDQYGIRVLPIKGPVLAQEAYGGISRREFRDIDLLLEKSDVPEAMTFLSEEGYTLSTYRHSNTPGEILQENTVIDPPLEFGFYQEGNISEVELRWQLGTVTRPLDLSFDALWERRQWATLTGATVQALSPEDRLIVLMVHGTGHYWHRLEWICDVAAVLRTHDDITWSIVIDRARELRRERDVFLGLLLAVEFTGVDVPAAVLQRARTNRKVASIACDVIRRFVDDPAVEPDSLSKLQFDLEMGEGFLGRLSVLRRAIVNPKPPDQEWIPLPRSLHPLYYVVRPFRLAGKYGLLALKEQNLRTTVDDIKELLLVQRDG